MTPGQQALADGWAATIATHGQTWTRTSDGALIVGVATGITIFNPGMVQAQDRPLTILVGDGQSYSRIKKADELTKDSRKYRVIRADLNESTGLWHVELSPTF